MKLKIAMITALGILAGCTDAEIASQNLSKAADMFEIDRRIVFYNGITDDREIGRSVRAALRDGGER